MASCCHDWPLGQNDCRPNGKSQDTVFLCGLLHAIGKPFVVHRVSHSRHEDASHLSWSLMIEVMIQSYREVG